MSKPQPKQKPCTLMVIAGVHKSDNGQVVMPGEVIEMHFPNGKYFNLLTSKLLIALLDLAGPAVVEDRAHVARIEALNWSHKDAGTIERAIRELQQTTVELTTTDGKEFVTKSGTILAHVERRHQASTREITVEFSKTFREVIDRSNYWGTLQKTSAMKMESKYALALYSFASLHANRWSPYTDWKIEDLRKRMMGDAKTLGRWQDFKRRALEPAIEEVNHLTDVHIRYEPLPLRPDGKRRRVDAVRMYVRRKTEEEMAEVKSELENGRQGRSRRRLNQHERDMQRSLDFSVAVDKSLSEPLRRTLLR